MDRANVFDGQTIQTVDILQTNKTNMVGMGFALQALLGTGVCVNGLQCTQTSPAASMSVMVAPGSIYQQDPVDVVAYGDLNPDPATIVKQGILYSPIILTPIFTGTAGQSQNFLVEVDFVDADNGLSVLPYFNPADPANPLWGATFLPSLPGGAPPPGAVPQNTNRTSLCVVSLKAGTPAATGTQTTPAADVGQNGLFVITLAFGYTVITNANITQLPTAPFFPNLPAIPTDLQNNLWTFALDTGTLNALVATIVPAPTVLTSGFTVQILVGFTNNGPATLNLNGLGATPIRRGTTGLALQPADIFVGQIATFAYDGTFWQLINYPNTFSSAQTNTFNSRPVAYAVDTGTVNHIVVSANCNTPAGLGNNVPPGPIVSLFTGLTIVVKVANSNTGPTDITINNLAPATVTTDSLDNSLEWFSMVAGEEIALVYDGNSFRKLPRKNKFFKFDEANPPPVFIPDPDFWPRYPRDRDHWWPEPLEGRDHDDHDPPAPVGVPPTPTVPLLPIAVGDQVNITFENVTTVPLRIATVPGIYEIEINITSSNTESCDHWHIPNDLLQLVPNNGVAPFQNWPHRNHDDDHFNFQSDVLGAIAEPDIAFGRFPTFERERDDDDGPRGKPPFFLKLTCVTFPFMKHIRSEGGGFGGPFHHHSRWVDVSVPWTSLGTFVVAKKRGHKRCPQDDDDERKPKDVDLAIVSGLAVVRRLA